MNTIDFPKPADLLFGLKTPDRGNKENMRQIKDRDSFSKNMTLYSVELISVFSSLFINFDKLNILSVVISDSN